MNNIVDRRLNGRNKSALNRARFVRRYKAQIKEAVTDAIGKRSIRDLERGERVDIPRQDTHEPFFHHGPGGRRETVHPGNREYAAGDRLPRPPGGGTGGRGQQASEDGEGEDDFSFVLTREEFLEFFFDDLALPDLVKTQLTRLPEYTRVRAGYTSTGVPTNLNVVRSLKSAVMRRKTLQAPHARQLGDIDALLADERDPERRAALEEERERLAKRVRAVPFIDTFDLRYNHRVRIPRPTTQAVMFCLMDVSGSMDQPRKDMAKRFFALLYLFLTRVYPRLDVVFIRHHTQAMEVSEEDFFSARDTGGTVVSTALALMGDIIKDRYANGDWNIYGAQASDGDNWHTDSAHCSELLAKVLLPSVQYFAYVQVGAEEEQGLWQAYAELAAAHPRLAMQKAMTAAEIYPVFRQLFARKVA
ncbi:MAG: YeaH/YhbH family protein [Gammaproteobacteria bacterium]